MNQDQLRQQLKAFQPTPREEWKHSDRAFFISMVSERYDELRETGKVLTPVQAISDVVRESFLQKTAFRFSGVFMILMLVLFGGYISAVGAASKAIPGDVLYPVKRANESVRVNIAKVLDTQKAGELQLAYAFERIAEAEKIVASPAPVEQKREQVKQAVNDVQKHIQGAQDSANALSKQGKDKEAVELATKVEQEAKTIAKVLEAKKETAIVQDEPAPEATLANDADKPLSDIKQVIDETTVKVGQVSFDALDLIIESFIAGKTEIKEEDLRQTITKQIVDLNSRAEIPNPAGQPTVTSEKENKPESSNPETSAGQSTVISQEKEKQPDPVDTKVSESQETPSPSEGGKTVESVKPVSESEGKTPIEPEIVFQVKVLIDEAQKLLDAKKYKESFEKIKQANGLMKAPVKTEEGLKPVEEKSASDSASPAPVTAGGTLAPAEKPVEPLSQPLKNP